MITANDMVRSRTLWALPQLVRELDRLRGLVNSGRLLDVGCGFGGLTIVVRNRLGFREAHGVDVDEAVIAEAQGKGVRAVPSELGKDPLPYPSEHFDLVTSFGMFDYLPSFDDGLREIHRVLRPGGFLLLTLPNLASWHNRLALLLGYQPRDVEVSREIVPGIHPYYRDENLEPTGHIHTVTTRGFRELAEHFGFSTVRIGGMCPTAPGRTGFRTYLDRLLAHYPPLAKRFAYAGRKRNGRG